MTAADAENAIAATSATTATESLIVDDIGAACQRRCVIRKFSEWSPYEGARLSRQVSSAGSVYWRGALVANFWEPRQTFSCDPMVHPAVSAA
jgi:hypothetical protein